MVGSVYLCQKKKIFSIIAACCDTMIPEKISKQHALGDLIHTSFFFFIIGSLFLSYLFVFISNVQKVVRFNL